MLKPGPIALRAMADALANTGVREQGDNAGKYVEIYLASVGLEAGNPWCAAWVYYRIKAASEALKLPMPAVPKSGYTPDWARWGKTHKLWMDVGPDAQVEPGDLALFYKASKGRIGHIGIVTGVVRSANAERKGVTTVEGNTDGDGSAEGDGVYAKERRFGDLGKYGGFVRLPF